LYFTLHPRNPNNRANFLWALETGAFLQGSGWSQINWPLLLASAGAPLLILAAWRPGAMKAALPCWLPPLALLAAFVALAPLVSPSTFAPGLQFMARSFAGLLPALLAALLLLAIGLDWRPDAAGRRILTIILSVMAAAQITWHVVATTQWAGYLAMFRATLAEGTGLVAVESTRLAEAAI